MTPDELPRREAAKWLRQAAKDRNAARVLLEPEPSRSVFHSQQAAEKAVKAFLTFHQIPFRKTHDLADLGSQCATADSSLERILREVGGSYRLRIRLPLSRRAVRAGCGRSGDSFGGGDRAMRGSAAAR